MKLKVYRTLNGVTEYWESWNAGGEAFIRSGKVGEELETRKFSFKDRAQMAQMMKEIESIEAAGFKPRQMEEYDQIVIRYRFNRWGSVPDHERRVAIEDLMTECLTRTGLGYCDGGELGSGAMIVFCEVVDAGVAEPIIVNHLQEHNHLEGAILARRERKGNDDYKVFWPKDFTGKFNLF
jgi:hypothetical protein